MRVKKTQFEKKKIIIIGKFGKKNNTVSKYFLKF